MFLYALPTEEENNGDTVNSSSYQKKAHNNTNNFYFFSSARFEQQKVITKEIGSSVISKATLLFSRVSTYRPLQTGCQCSGEKKNQHIHLLLI